MIRKTSLSVSIDWSCNLCVASITRRFLPPTFDISLSGSSLRMTHLLTNYQAKLSRRPCCLLPEHAERKWANNFCSGSRKLCRTLMEGNLDTFLLAAAARISAGGTSRLSFVISPFNKVNQRRRQPRL